MELSYRREDHKDEIPSRCRFKLLLAEGASIDAGRRDAKVTISRVRCLSYGSGMLDFERRNGSTHQGLRLFEFGRTRRANHDLPEETQTPLEQVCKAGGHYGGAGRLGLPAHAPAAN